MEHLRLPLGMFNGPVTVIYTDTPLWLHQVWRVALPHPRHFPTATDDDKETRRRLAGRLYPTSIVTRYLCTSLPPTHSPQPQLKSGSCRRGCVAGCVLYRVLVSPSRVKRHRDDLITRHVAAAAGMHGLGTLPTTTTRLPGSVLTPAPPSSPPNTSSTDVFK